MPDESGCRIGTVVFEGFQVTKTAVLINEGELVIIPAVLSGISCRIADQTCCRHIFQINLHSLSRMIHLLIWLWNVLGIREFYCHFPAASQETVQPGYGSGIASSPQLDPKHDNPGVGVPSPHILYEFDLLRPVLVRVLVRAVRAVFQ